MGCQREHRTSTSMARPEVTSCLMEKRSSEPPIFGAWGLLNAHPHLDSGCPHMLTTSPARTAYSAGARSGWGSRCGLGCRAGRRRAIRRRARARRDRGGHRRRRERRRRRRRRAGHGLRRGAQGPGGVGGVGSGGPHGGRGSGCRTAVRLWCTQCGCSVQVSASV